MTERNVKMAGTAVIDRLHNSAHYCRRGLGALSGALAFALLSSCSTAVLDPNNLGLSGSNAGNGFTNGPKISVQSVRARDPQSRLGTREHPKILSLYGGTFEDQKVERLLAVIVGKLVDVADDPGRAYQVTILNSPSVNAFALPGGYVYVTRGLLALANDSSELAAVIAHEMAHVAANHGILRNEKVKDVKVAGQVVKDLLAGQPARISQVPASGKLLLAQFSRNQELEADLLGVKIAGRAGYDPYAQARYLGSMRGFATYKSGAEGGQDRLDFLSTHPSAPKRIEFATRHARQFGEPGTGTRDRERYLAGIDGLRFGDTAQEGFVRGRTYSHPSLKVTFTVPEGYTIDNRKEAIVATGPDKIAVRVDAAPLAQNKSLVNYLNSGWIGGLTPRPPQTLTINGLEALRGQAAADGWLFDITLIRTGDRVYRLIAAAPAGVATLTNAGDAVSKTFRHMSNREVAALKPLRIKIHTVRSGETLANLAAKRMKWSDRGAALLAAINGLSPNARLAAGSKIKLIVEG